MTLGCAGSEMSQICPSPMHAAAAMCSGWNTVTSWQPTDGAVSNVETDAFLGFASGTVTTESYVCALQSCPWPRSGYDSMYRYTFPCCGSGYSVFVCEPQSVGTAVTNLGCAASCTS